MVDWIQQSVSPDGRERLPIKIDRLSLRYPVEAVLFFRHKTDESWVAVNHWSNNWEHALSKRKRKQGKYSLNDLRIQRIAMTSSKRRIKTERPFTPHQFHYDHKDCHQIRTFHRHHEIRAFYPNVPFILLTPFEDERIILSVHFPCLTFCIGNLRINFPSLV